MFKINDYVVYKRDVCLVKEIKMISNKNYYVLSPIDDASLKISVPVENELIRPILSMNDANMLIEKIPNICPLTVNDKMIENEYKNLLNGDSIEDLIRIIKTTYLRNDERKNLGKKIGEKDDTYFKKAERILYNELSLSLNMSYEDVSKYVYNKVSELCK